MQKIINVEIYADIICPWCFIGKKRLDKAFLMRPNITPRYIWRCFLLNPRMPRVGMDRQDYLNGKFGHEKKTIYSQIAAAGIESGINFNFDLIQRTPDSRVPHRYILAANELGCDLSDTFFEAYFLDGKDIGDHHILNNIVEKKGLKLDLNEEICARIDKKMENDLNFAKQFRIDGVPYIVFEEQYSIAGAHKPEHIIPVIDAASSN